ncbi:unnamed protein product [Linum tenue]|uniref:RING-type E3 ubiquitin transferase n=1 Tax=Linum tenue TaxID=586396 RepID=A0AAV0JNK2_9ROSI|nr:unnamed protein product [Linum tenue]
MAALQPPKTLIPLIDKHKNDCSQQGICSLLCPQLCLKAIFPNPSPPSPPNQEFSNAPTTNFSPIVIAIICILAGALLLLSYYTLISKYCRGHTTEDPDTSRSRGRGRRRRQNNLIHHNHTGDEDDEFGAAGDVMNSSLHEPWQWHVSLTTGLDEAQIKSITVCKYRKEDGLLVAGGSGRGGTEHHCCSVCLSEFRDGESLRLLPKCSHAFHLDCIDTWLRTHSTCPLCRANIFFFGTETPAAAAAGDGAGRVELVVEGAEQSENEYSNGGVNEDRDERLRPSEQVVRRCASMDHLCLRIGSGGYDRGVSREEEERSKHEFSSQSSSSRRVVDTVKRSFSSGRLFSLARHGNRPCVVHPATVPSTSTSNV